MKDFKSLFSALVLYRHNVHILHWKVVGPDFDPTHKKLDEYVSKFNELIDSTAEMMLMQDLNPIGLCDCTKVAEEDDSHDYLVLDPSNNYTSEECFEYIKTMFDMLIEMYDEMYEIADLPKDIESELQTHQYWFRLESKYKSKARLTSED